MKLIKDNRTAKHILKLMSEKYGFINNLYINKLGYIDETGKIQSAYNYAYKSIIYKNKCYKITFFDGCFIPYLIQTDIP